MNFFFFQIRLTELIFLTRMTQRIEPFFSCDAKNWTFFLFASKNWGFFLNMTQRIEPFFLQFDSKNWTFLFLQYDSKNWTFFNMTQRIERLFEYDTKNWISFWGWFKESNSFLNTTRRMKRFFLNTTQWIEPSLTWLEEFIFFQKKKRNDSKNWNFLSMSQRIEFLSFFGRKKTTQRIELFSKIRYKELNFFSIWLNFFQNMTRRIWPFLLPWLKDFALFFVKKNQRIWLFYDSQTWTFFFFFNIFPKKDSKNWAFFLNYDSPNIFFFEVRMRLTEHFFQYDSQNWFFFLNMTFFFDIELFLNATQRIEISNTTQRNNFFSLICLKE